MSFTHFGRRSDWSKRSVWLTDVAPLLLSIIYTPATLDRRHPLTSHTLLLRPSIAPLSNVTGACGSDRDQSILHFDKATHFVITSISFLVSAFIIPDWTWIPGRKEHRKMQR